jgi:hypothetical protein
VLTVTLQRFLSIVYWITLVAVAPHIQVIHAFIYSYVKSFLELRLKLLIFNRLRCIKSVHIKPKCYLHSAVLLFLRYACVTSNIRENSMRK